VGKGKGLKFDAQICTLCFLFWCLLAGVVFWKGVGDEKIFIFVGGAIAPTHAGKTQQHQQ